MPSYVFKLSFTQISCSGCGINRIRGIDCPDCGRSPQPWEIDTAARARREAAAEARKLLTQPVASPPTTLPTIPQTPHVALLDRMATWSDGFFSSVAEAAKATTRGAEDLRASVQEFMQLRAMVQHTDARRPLVVMLAVLHQAVTELHSMIDAYLAALLAATPLEAQRHATQAQSHLDRAVRHIKTANTAADEAQALAAERDTARLQSLLLTHALHTYEAADLLSLDAAARDKLQDVTSSRGAHGSGIMFAIGNVLAHSLFDPERFREVMRRAYDVFRSNPDVLRALAQEALFESDFKRALQELFDGSREAIHVVDNAVHDRQAGRALLGIAMAQVEGPGQVIASALLLACGRKSAPYTKLRHSDATGLITAARQEARLHGLLDGLDNDLRTGRAHALVHYEEAGVVIERRKSTRTVAWPEVIDGVFQGYESIHACQLALWQALAELGFTAFATDDLWRELGLTSEQMVTMMLEGSGYRDVAITVGEKDWQVETRSESASTLSFHLALIRTYLPKYVERLTLTVRQDSEVHILSGPLAPWHEVATAPTGSEAHMMAYLRAQLAWTYDGVPVLSTEHIRLWVALQAAQTMQQTPAQAIIRLRSFRDLARHADDDELVWALTGVIRYKRLEKTANAAAELSRLQSWCSLPVALPNWC
ncbi:hypothetical protein [Streptomyces olivaceus]|uniref:hypothetical protein n=1 Tax=Streptomyces olivaceus TaxID=47716 RepID=UPI001CCD909D|nr:hypothetical protein [Streptomyces olivaceus]MBZ6135441.1 hypothetical protein [Streptomyces olivaceus]